MSSTNKIPPTVTERQKEIQKLTVLEKYSLNAYLVSEIKGTEKLIIAYQISRPKESQANRQSIYMQARKWINSDKVKYYLELRQKELFKPEPKQATAGEQEQTKTQQNTKRTKEETIAELNQLADDTTDAKLKAEILIKISDLSGWKKEQEKTDDNTIRYYLPLRCNVCSLYQAAKTAQNRQYKAKTL